MDTEIDHVFLRRLRHLGFAEGVSTLVLFGVAMPLKYVWNMPLAVSIVGALHGLLFVALVAILLVAADRVPIGRRLAIVGALAAVVPFGPFVFDRRLARLTDARPSTRPSTRPQDDRQRDAATRDA